VTRFFVLKAWLAGSGVAVGLVGMRTEQRWLGWIAVALLAAAFLLRFGERNTPEP
jgi:hypothetical protein